MEPRTLSSEATNCCASGRVIEAQAQKNGGVYAREGGSEDARRGGDVIGVEQHGRVLIARIGQFVEWEVGGFQLIVGAAATRAEHGESRIRRHRAEARVELVLRPAVSAGMEVAAGARLAVTANGHIPEPGPCPERSPQFCL